jgi:flagellar basal body rod protein FlgC
MSRPNINYSAGRDEFIFLPGHPEADSKGFINIHNRSLLSEMAGYILEAQKTFHEAELKNKRKIRTLKF